MKISAISVSCLNNNPTFSAKRSDKSEQHQVKSVSSYTIPMLIAAMTLASSVGSCSKDDTFEYNKLNDQKDSLEMADSTGYKPPFDVVIDMEGSMPYSSVILGTLVDKGSYIFNPLKLSASLSEDGVDYTEVAVAEYDVMGQDDPDGIMDYTLSFPQTQARYLKLSCTPLEFLPQWHYAAGRRAFVFVDEIVVK